MSEDESSSPFGASAAVLMVLVFLCSGVPALLICGGIGATSWDLLSQLIGS